MEKLWSVSSANNTRSLLLKNEDDWEKIADRINRVSLSSGIVPSFVSHEFNRRSASMPDISCIYLPGLLAFREDLLPIVFPVRTDQARIELLPMLVDDRNWIMVNCLETVDEFDESRSQVLRGEGGQIFMVSHLELSAASVDQKELFTLGSSNRTQLFMRTSFRDRIVQHNLRGVDFQEIGCIV